MPLPSATTRRYDLAMPITADKVRELAARGESATLDFKEQMYDFTNRTHANAELAKDLMAMANSIRANSEPAYILIGVKDDGSIVGVPASSHPDDAVLHQKVAGLLDRTPTFAYAPIEVDGCSVGVFEIRGGGRPYFPLKDQGNAGGGGFALRRHVALYRNGSSSDLASPRMILDWAREDDPDAHRHRSLELRELEARARVHGSLKVSKNFTSADSASYHLILENTGSATFTALRCLWRLEWNESFHKLLRQHIDVTLKGQLPSEMERWRAGIPEDYEPPSGEMAIKQGGRIPPSHSIAVRFLFRREDALRHIKENNVPFPGFNGSLARFHLDVPCDGDLGGFATVSISVP